MKVIKTINNNAAICLDSNGNEVVIIGRGVGFHKPPYELDDLSKITHTYYDVNPSYIDLLNEIPHEIFDISSKIINYINVKIKITLDANFAFSLADHIHFAIERYQRGIQLENPLYHDIQHLYEEEYELGKNILQIIYNNLSILLPKEEAANLALIIVNAEIVSENKKKRIESSQLLTDITEIIADYFKLYIDKNSVSYARFITHLQYLHKRGNLSKVISSDNFKMYHQISDTYPETAKCVKLIATYLKEHHKMTINEEEELYLILHINRLCSRNEKGEIKK